MVDYHAARLVKHLKAGGARGQPKIGVLVIRGSVAAVKSPGQIQETALGEKAGSGAVIHLTELVEARVGLVFKFAVGASAAVLKNFASRFLQSPIGIDQLGPHHGNLVGLIGSIDERLKPAMRDLCVIVEKYDVPGCIALDHYVVSVHESGVDRGQNPIHSARQ